MRLNSDYARVCRSKRKVTNSSSYLIEEKKDDEELTPLEIKIKRIQERHPVVEDFKIRVSAKMLVSPCFEFPAPQARNNNSCKYLFGENSYTILYVRFSSFCLR